MLPGVSNHRWEIPFPIAGKNIIIPNPANPRSAYSLNESDLRDIEAAEKAATEQNLPFNVNHKKEVIFYIIPTERKQEGTVVKCVRTFIVFRGPSNIFQTEKHRTISRAVDIRTKEIVRSYNYDNEDNWKSESKIFTLLRNEWFVDYIGAHKSIISREFRIFCKEIPNENNLTTLSRRLTSADKICVAYQLINVLITLHSCQLVHGNLTYDLIILRPTTERERAQQRANYIVKISSFYGLAKRDDYSNIYTHSYVQLAQSGLLAEGYQYLNSRTDSWALGVILFELFTGKKVPFFNMPVEERLIFWNEIKSSSIEIWEDYLFRDINIKSLGEIEITLLKSMLSPFFNSELIPLPFKAIIEAPLLRLLASYNVEITNQIESAALAQAENLNTFECFVNRMEDYFVMYSKNDGGFIEVKCYTIFDQASVCQQIENLKQQKETAKLSFFDPTSSTFISIPTNLVIEFKNKRNLVLETKKAIFTNIIVNSKPWLIITLYFNRKVWTLIVLNHRNRYIAKDLYTDEEFANIYLRNYDRSFIKLEQLNFIYILARIAGTDDHIPYLFTKLTEGKNLADVLFRSTFITNDIMSIAYQLIDALAKLHDGNLVHGNLCIESINIRNATEDEKKIHCGNHTIFLTNFGRTRYQGITTNFLKTQYIAPEEGSISEETTKLAKEKDIWALGVVLYQLFSGSLPPFILHFENSSDDIQMNLRKMVNMSKPELEGFLKLNQFTPEQACILRATLNPDPLGRTTAIDLAHYRHIRPRINNIELTNPNNPNHHVLISSGILRIILLWEKTFSPNSLNNYFHEEILKQSLSNEEFLQAYSRVNNFPRSIHFVASTEVVNDQACDVVKKIMTFCKKRKGDKVIVEDSCKKGTFAIDCEAGGVILSFSPKQGFEELFQNEVNVRKVLKNEKGVVPFIGANQYVSAKTHQKKDRFFVTYVEGKNLDSWIKSKELSVNNRLSIAYQLAKALEGIHQSDLVHGNIKSSNMLLKNATAQEMATHQGDYTVLISDFSDTVRTHTLCKVSSLKHISPEDIEKLRSLEIVSKPQSDVWALGIIFYELFLNHAPPFCIVDPLEPLYNKLEKLRNMSKQELDTYLQLDKCTSLQKRILQGALDPNLRSRASAREIASFIFNERNSEVEEVSIQTGPHLRRSSRPLSLSS